MNRAEMEHALGSCEFFELLGKSEIAEIAGLCQANTYKSGEYVFQQGDHGEHLYIIIQGHIYLERSMDLGARKGNIVIETLGREGFLVAGPRFWIFPTLSWPQPSVKNRQRSWL